MLLVSLVIIIAGVILPKLYGRYVAAAGWVLFGLYWGLSTPFYYLHEHNIMYTVACILAIPATFYGAYILVRYGRESLMVLTRCAAIASVFYFPFQYIPWLNQWLIETTTTITFWIITALGEPAMRNYSPDSGINDIIVLNGQRVQIILACTAIQSMAIFVGVVGAVRVDWRRWLTAFLISVPVIYVLNLGRNLFVISSFGNQWFQIMPDTVVGWTGEPVTYTSFFWAHNVIAETGSLVALVVISYAVMTMMPELLSYLMDILDLIKIENIKKMLKGQEVLAKPLQRVK
ncbi:MAG TPA: archaeosortase A [Methanocella sp.]|jgi:archaeosortase A (PGF-CTERM-specific)